MLAPSLKRVRAANRSAMRFGLAAATLYILAVATAVTAEHNTAAAQNTKPRAEASQHTPQYTPDGQLVFPSNYREWVYLSSGLGMTYTGPMGEDDPMFTNVFVTPEAYRAFTVTGKWPDKTVFVVEERGSSRKGSINKGGHYQSEFMGLGVEVKDESRFPEKWAYFAFGPRSESTKARPKDKCWQCHEDHAAVEHSFVQFYPTLKPIAQKFGTYKTAVAESQR
jgi:hypothetical protein